MKPANIKSSSLVKIVWTDSAFEQGWRYAKAPLPLPEITTVGFVTHCTDDMIEVASSVGNKGGSLNPLGLPWGMIKHIETIRGPLGN